nr:MAG TPA: hypothetical protein [Caudoviricetes sp.]DAN01546.1 MAG TPA: hypothetical protein [Caudoviricetes sp.]
MYSIIRIFPFCSNKTYRNIIRSTEILLYPIS